MNVVSFCSFNATINSLKREDLDATAIPKGTRDKHTDMLNLSASDQIMETCCLSTESFVFPVPVVTPWLM